MSEADIKQMILNEVGNNIPDFPVEIPIDNLWSFFEEFANQEKLRIAHVKKQAILHLIGQFRHKTTAGLGPLNPQLKQKFDNLQAMLSSCESDIVQWEMYYQSNRRAFVKHNRKKAPIEACDYEPDPNSRALRGDAIDQLGGFI